MANSTEDVRRMLSQVRRSIMQKQNVVATGIGYKITGGEQTDTLAITCSVENKQAKEQLSSRDLIPEAVEGIPTDVITTGMIYAQQERPDRFRPAPGGTSIGHYLITAGTLGCLVQRDDQAFILSNNHVLANSNDAEIGDPVLQPGPHDGGSVSGDTIASLEQYVPIRFATEDGDQPCSIGSGIANLLNVFAAMVGSRTRLQSIRPQQEENLVDCALATPKRRDDVSAEILEIGDISGIAEGSLGMEVQKSGRTTGLTSGTIQQIDVTAKVSYGANKVATFTDQLMAGNMSQGGDSGSAVLNMDNEVIGLLFAGSNTTTVINRIQNVLSALAVDIYTGNGGE